MLRVQQNANLVSFQARQKVQQCASVKVFSFKANLKLNMSTYIDCALLCRVNKASIIFLSFLLVNLIQAQ